jgi:hypothetical protein
MKFIDGGPRVIRLQSLPTRLPIISTAVLGLLLDRIDAPGWLWGALGVIVATAWAATIAFIIWERHADPFDPREQQR